MPRKRTAATATGGASWRRASGQRAIGLTLPEEEANRLGSQARLYGLSAAELCRRLARWVLSADESDQKKIKKILDCD